jgi:hypothetical protein
MEGRKEGRKEGRTKAGMTSKIRREADEGGRMGSSL